MVVQDARDALVGVARQAAVGIIPVFLGLAHALFLEVPGQGRGGPVVIRRPHQLVTAHPVVDRLPPVTGVGVAQVVHRPKLLLLALYAPATKYSPSRTRVLQQPRRFYLTTLQVCLVREKLILQSLIRFIYSYSFFVLTRIILYLPHNIKKG